MSVREKIFNLTTFYLSNLDVIFWNIFVAFPYTETLQDHSVRLLSVLLVSFLTLFQAVENVRGVNIEDDAYRGRDEDLDLEPGSQHILRYSSVRNHLRSGAVKLI